MTTAIRKHMRDFIAVIVLVVLAAGVGGFILSNQRFYLPGWVPFAGTDFFQLKAEFSTAQAVTPGQGQTVNIAGVPVGEINNVELVDGRAVVTMDIQKKYSDLIKRDATMLLRPKTGLKDMIIEVNPGTPGAPRVSEDYTIPVGQTRPDVNVDEILGSLDRDTRDYLRLLVSGGGEALKRNGPALAATLRRFEPLNREAEKITTAVAKRRRNLARLIHSLNLLVTSVGGQDKELQQLIVSQNAVFESFANQDKALQETLRLLPGTLATTRATLTKSSELTDLLTPTLKELQPGAAALAPGQRALRPFARQTTPILKNQLRPFAKKALPTVNHLKPALRDLSFTTPRLSSSFTVLNKLLNALAYKKSGSAEGYLFWALWLNHIGASVYSTDDANGLIRRGLILTDCVALDTLQTLATLDAQLGTLIDLSNFPTKQDAQC